MKSQASTVLVTFMATLPSVLAWGDLGHETIAYVASNFVSDDTAQFFQNILGDSSSSYLANVATYADSYKYTEAGSYSEPYHFINALDNPPQTCNVDYNRDCPDDNCVVAAISNYTQILIDQTESNDVIILAAKMVVHFVGDVHQPLHDENLEYGCNDVDVTFNGESTNLHHTWDTEMPEQYANGYSRSDASSWANALTTAIQSGQYQSESSSWTSGININDPQGASMAWASDANAFVCSVVIPDGYQAYENTDLAGNYYNGVLPTIQLQFAKAGYRLAAWLDLIATGQTSL